MKKPTLTNKEVYQLRQWLYECSDLKGQKFAYAILKNRNHVDSYIKNIEETMTTPSKEYLRFDEQRDKLARKNSERDANGEPMTKMEGMKRVYVIKNKEKFDADSKELKDKFKETIKEREKQIKTFEKFSEKIATVELHMIESSDVPEDITANLLEGISVLLVDSIE